MKRAALVATLVALVGLFVIGARELWLARKGEARSEQSLRTVSVEASVTPSVHMFGQPVVATVLVVADAALVKPRTIRVETEFAPYELAGKPTIERKVANGTARVLFRFPLRCLSEGCDPAEGRGVAQFETGFVHYRFVRGSGPGRDLIDWPPIQVASRVTDVEVSDMRWRASSTALPETTMRFGPLGLAAGLVVAALVLAGAATWLAVRLWRVEQEPDAEPVDLRSPLERSLDLVLAVSRNGVSGPEHRRTLERLARELDAQGYGALARDARELAWSTRSPTGREVAHFARSAVDAVRVGTRA